jgi:D-alanyl-D-alanine carboxypeptidase/D-alanyl-D-alanine-endopeptidase (penicillin-binding protein 4)
MFDGSEPMSRPPDPDPGRRGAARRRAPLAALTCALAVATASPATAPAAAPDRPAVTPIARGASATASSPISAAALRRGLSRALKAAGGRSGAWVKDLSAGKRLFSRHDKRRLELASNTKLFTTGTAITRLGPAARLETAAWVLGSLGEGGVLYGSLLLRGGGDPTLTSKRLAKLASRVRAAGVRRVTAGLRFDDSIFDRRRGIPSAGVSGGPYLGSLSGLSVDYGLNRHGNLLKDPAATAARLFRQALRRRGVAVPGKLKRRRLPAGAPGEARIASLQSSTMAALIAATNQPSDNFMAEMLAKGIGARIRARGTTAAGVKVVRHFAASHGAGLSAQNGSGLSVRDRASPRSVGRFLAAMRREQDGIPKLYTASLSLAGHSGTLADRMRGTAADGRCRGKTGTLTGASALSGYCFAPGGRLIAFSILMNRVDVYAAHRSQDRMAALIARYRP